MTVKRYVSPYAAGTESFRSMRDTRGRTVPDPDEGPFYVLASDHDAEVAALRERLAEAERLILFYGGHVPPCAGRPCSCHFQEVWDAITARAADSAEVKP